MDGSANNASNCDSEKQGPPPCLSKKSFCFVRRTKTIPMWWAFGSKEKLQKRLEEESHETRLHCNQRKACSKQKQREGESGRGAQRGQLMGCDLNLGKATGNASQVVCVSVCFLPMRDTFFPKRNQELWLQATWWADGFPWLDAFRQKEEGHGLKRWRLDF